jgi:hypothetical protein
VSPFTTAAEKDVTESVVGYLEGEMRTPESSKKVKGKK